MADLKYKKQLDGLGFEGVVIGIEEALKTQEDPVLLEQIRSQRLDIDPLYANFTSGSTGIPKGVVVSHRSVIDFMEDFTEIFGITDKDVIGNQAPFDFDVSVKDIYSTLRQALPCRLSLRNSFRFPRNCWTIWWNGK